MAKLRRFNLSLQPLVFYSWINHLTLDQKSFIAYLMASRNNHLIVFKSFIFSLTEKETPILEYDISSL